MKLEKITLHFENCDCITIDGKYIGNFYVGDIKTVIQRIACNSIRPMNIAYKFAIEIHKDADKEHFPLGIKEDKQSVFDRLTVWNDITSIEFTLVEQCDDAWIPIEKHYSYYVHWAGNNDAINSAQKHYISKQGHLYIVISEEETIEDYFNKEKIDDKDCMESTCAMYEIGDEHFKQKEN